MAYHEEEQLKQKRLNANKAIALAMQGRWEDAIGVNKIILASFPDDVDAYNRLGRAYLETGVYTEAKQAYEHSLKLDPYNTIAKKNLMRLSHMQEAPVSSKERMHKVEPQFIEEAGKSGVVSLQRLAGATTLVRLVAGDKVNLSIDEGNMVAKTDSGEYVGQVEPRHAQRLVKLIKGGNQYSAAIINASETKVTIIIRETYQHPNMVGQISFPPRWAESVRQATASEVTESDEDDEGLDEEGIADDEDSGDLSDDFSSTDDVENLD